MSKWLANKTTAQVPVIRSFNMSGLQSILQDQSENVMFKHRDCFLPNDTVNLHIKEEFQLNCSKCFFPC